MVAISITMASDLRIEWVVCDGIRVPVSSFGALPRRARPEAHCPECRDVVTLKLGNERRHHAAHRAGSVCGALNPETALHINVKCHIAAELSKAIGQGATLRVRRGCLAERCSQTTDESWMDHWDAVAVEFRLVGPVGHRVPDIALMKEGRVVAAIEVLVSHAVDAEKAAMLEVLDVPWIEVRAAERLYHQPDAWTIAAPLNAERDSVAAGWRCETHTREHKNAIAVAERRAEYVAGAALNGNSIEALRVADVYRENGSVMRLQYRIVGVVNAGVLRRLALERHGNTLSAYLADPDESADAFRARVSADLHRDFLTDLAGEKRHGAFTDSPMRWLRGEQAAGGAPVRRYPQRYQFEADRNTWSVKPALSGAQWPVATDAASVRQSVEIALRGTRRGPQTSLVPRDEDNGT
ncbi:MAG: competence protein CoiA family protein [Gemmatimonadaceae bacterium]